MQKDPGMREEYDFSKGIRGKYAKKHSEGTNSDESCVPVPQSHTEELDRRLDKYQCAPGYLLSLEELRARIEKRK